MRYFVPFHIALMLIQIPAISAQTVNFADGFEDGDFTSNPAWTGDTSQFSVTNRSSYLLQLNSATTDPAYLSTPSTNTEGAWEFYIEFDGFEPSGSNRAEIFLMSDIADLEGAVNGYAVQVGQSGDDVFKIVRYDNGVEAATVLADTTVISSGGGGYRIRVTRATGGSWRIEVGTGYGGALYDAGDTAIDNTYSSSGHLGLRVTFTSTRSDRFLFDFKTDLPPFSVTGAMVHSKREIDVTSSQPYDPSTVQTYDFTLDRSIGSPASVSFPNANTIRLAYSDPIPSQSYTLTVQNLLDLNDQSLSQNTTGFIVVAEFSPGDVILNEFTYDPPSESEEYIELKNVSDKYLSLRDWQLGDSRSLNTVTTKSLTLKPNGYLVISSDTAALFNLFGSRPYIQMSSFPSLNNSGDAVRIVSNSGQLVDSLTYTPRWGGIGVALERRSGSVSSEYPENWNNSPHPLGGTPGAANEVSPDLTPPALLSMQILNKSSLALLFDERLDTTSATNTRHFTLTSGAGVASLMPVSPDSLVLGLTAPLLNAETYTLTIDGLEDIFGNTITAMDTTFTYYEISAADSGDVFINEFMYDPFDGGTEYVEMYNVSEKSLDLRGWTINDNTGQHRTLTSSRYILPPNGMVVIAPDLTLKTLFPNLPVIALGTSFPSLNNGGDHIVLRDSSGIRLDSLAYSATWGGEEVALERRSTSVSGTYSSNWGEAPGGFGTPGKPNETAPDVKPPNLTELKIPSSQAIYLSFDEPLNASSFDAPSNFSISPDIHVEAVALLSERSLQLSLGTPLQNANPYTLRIQGGADVFGNSVVEQDTLFTFYEVSPADSGDVFVNEFMYNPPEGSSEYIEVYNASDKSLDVQGWTINDNTGSRINISVSSLILPPEGYLIVAPDSIKRVQNGPATLRILGSSFPTLNNAGDHIVLRDSTGTLLDSLTYDAGWDGTGQALERRTVSVSGVFASNWGNAPNGFGTPGTANEITEDTTPPHLTKLSILGGSSLRLTFDEVLNHQTSTALPNYQLSAGSTIDQVTRPAYATVELRLSSPLRNATSYTLSVQGVSDVFGNNIAGMDTTFTYFEITNPDSGDVFITEFMYNPPAGESEYVELFNASDKSLNLQGWTLNDNTGNTVPISDSSSVFPPKSFVVIAPDVTLLESNPEITLIAIGSNFPALNNSGDDIVLRTRTGLLLDSLRYTSGWGGSEAALARRTHALAASYPENWGNAPNRAGSPGEPNIIERDESAPRFTKLAALDESTLLLTFSERLDPQTATETTHFSLDPIRKVKTVTVEDNKVTLGLDQALQSGQSYRVMVKNLQDVFGNRMVSDALILPFIKFSTAGRGDVVINEILYTRRDGSDPEFVELFNPTNRNFMLTGWQLGDASGKTPLQEGLQIMAGDYLVLTGHAALADSLPGVYYVPGFPSLNDTGDAVYVQALEGLTIDSLYYNADWNNAEKGSSIERRDPLAASNDSSNWQPHPASPGHTAGAVNTSYRPDEIPPQVMFANFTADGHIEVLFSEFVTPSRDLVCLLGDEVLRVKHFTADRANRIVLSPPRNKSLANTNGVKLTVQNLTDVRGNTTDATTISVAHPMEPGSVVINEILFNPLNESDDNKPDQSEYIELRNIRDHAVSLEGLYLHDAPDENASVRPLIPVSSSAKWIPPHGLALIYADEASRFGESSIVQFFEVKAGKHSAVMRINGSSLSLASAGDAIYLADSTGNVIDSVHYDERWHNPNLMDARGVALERINPAGKSNDPANWGSSISLKGGTPYAENTLYQVPGAAPRQIGMTFSPNPFSPDNDGFDDHLLISYKLDQPDYLMKVHIYDRYGRLIRELADGQPAGFEGTLIWDGRRDDGARNRIGIYIVVFEAYNSTNGENRAFKETVVLARQL